MMHVDVELPEEIAKRLRAARRIWRGNAWCWDLKPDYTPGDVFEI